MARKILLADDSVTAQNMGRKILADAGYEVTTVNNGSAALKKIAELKPELIILDVYMPGYSGLEVCQRLKDAPETARIPVLLSVGKLEPFKPDEAKRVRAEGYIVKPFEASELLSALSKLEDKIVPKAETGKPVRMSRAVAGADESSRSGDEPVAEGSWKNRISFPGKKKESVPENPDDGALYNAVNRDLKTVVQRDEPKTQNPPLTEANGNHARDQVKVENPEAKLVDLGALATTGLPKDVTTEEIAALAAAAAHVHGRKLEAEGVVKAAEQEIKAEEKIASPEPAPQTAAEQPIAQTTAPETVAAQTAPLSVTPTEDEVSAAIACLENEQKQGAEQVWNVNSGNGAEHSSERPEDLPVTMAASAPSETSEGSRWTAVPVAVDPQEAMLSLEREMQIAFRAFSAAAATQAGPATSTVDEPQSSTPQSFAQQSSVQQSLDPQSSAPQSSAPVEAALDNISGSSPSVDSTMEVKSEPVAAVPAEMAAETPVEESGTAITEFAVAQGQEIPDHSGQPDYSTPVQMTVTATVTGAVSEDMISQVVPSEPVNISAESTTTSQPKQEEARQEETPQEEQPQAVGQVDQPAVAESSEAIAGVLASTPLTSVEPTSGEGMVADATDVETLGAQQSPVIADVPASTSSEIALAITPDTAREQNVPQHDVAQQNMQSNDSEVAATTAAAWATWRQIRDSVPALKSQEPTGNGNEEPTQDSAAAAFAAAAGAETSPSMSASSAETTTAVTSQTVASIVDSLLAELRPRIVEEISRKLAAEKK